MVWFSCVCVWVGTFGDQIAMRKRHIGLAQEMQLQVFERFRFFKQWGLNANFGPIVVKQQLNT